MERFEKIVSYDKKNHVVTALLDEITFQDIQHLGNLLFEAIQFGMSLERDCKGCDEIMFTLDQNGDTEILGAVSTK